MKIFFNFGESIDAYDFKVINEREARASAGLMFLFGLLSMFSVYLFRTLLWAELFTMTFIFEFFVRLVFAPKYAPYMMIASFIVHNQEPEWVEAKPKKFAWALGGVLALIMSYYLLFDVISLARFSICVVCLSLLFLESAFGICLGCKIYHFLEIKLHKCPGGVCQTNMKRAYELKKVALLFLFILAFISTYIYLDHKEQLHTKKIIIVGTTEGM